MLDTFPKLLIERARTQANKPASRIKEYGIWQTWTWGQVKKHVDAFANGLAAIGIKPSDKVAILGKNKPELYWSMVAVQSIGAIPVPMYHDAVADELQYVLDHAEVSAVIVEDQEQVDKVLDIQPQCPRIKELVYIDPRGLRAYDTTHLNSFTGLEEKGNVFAAKNPEFLTKSIEQSSGSDIAIFMYTSGTTGRPKGVVLTYDNIIISSQNGIEFEGLSADEETLAYLPMAWIGDHIFSIGQSYLLGYCVSCPESEETILSDLREIGPTYYFAPPRVFETMLTSVMIRMEDAGVLKRKMFHYFMGHAKRVGIDILDGKPTSLKDKLLYSLGNILVYGPLKDALGLGRIRLVYTAGEAIGPELFEFYRSIGINMKQIYGQTEACVYVTIQPDGEIRSDTVGIPAIDVEVKIGDNNEVLYRGPGVFHSYYKNPEATAETKTKEGWVHTGDAGYFDDSGHLHIIDRSKDVGSLNNGSMFAPKYIENRLKFFSHIKEVVAFGDGRDYCTAFINIDLDAVSNWAEKNNISYGSYQELAARAEVYQLMQDGIEQLNQSLIEDAAMSDSQIDRFVILHKELDADDGELTRTQKVRRRLIADKYKVLIDALYEDVDHCYIDIEVAFEDGRKGSISGDLEIRKVKTFEMLKKVG